MKTAVFHVFSGTGNTRHLALALQERLGRAGFGQRMVEVSASAIPRRSGKAEMPPPRGADDLDLFLFPVYALALPRIMTRYIRALGRAKPLADGERPRAAILSTNGRISARYRDGHEGQALAQADRLLASLGWAVVYRDTVDYPQSITSVIPAQDEERRAAILALSMPRIEAIAADLAAGRGRKRPCSPFFHLLGWPFGWLFRLAGRRAWAMLFAADGRCDGCGLCAARCPAQAIRMRRARPSWSYACEGCERCINLCPKEAIQASALRAAVMVAFCVALVACPTPSILFTVLPFLPAWPISLAWPFAATAVGFILMRLIDLGLVALAFIPGLRDILAFGWTRSFRRYPDPNRLHNATTSMNKGGRQ